MDSVILWVESYCNKNPLHDFPNAVNALINELYQNRTTKEPSDNIYKPDKKRDNIHYLRGSILK